MSQLAEQLRLDAMVMGSQGLVHFAERLERAADIVEEREKAEAAANAASLFKRAFAVPRPSTCPENDLPLSL